MRTQTTAAAAKSIAKVDCEPILVVSVTWPTSGVINYSDKTGSGLDSRIKEVSGIGLKTISRSSAAAGTVTVTLIDTDQDIFTKLKTQLLDNALASVYQHYEGLTFSTDKILLYSGRIATPLTYDEVQRTLSFDIIPAIKTFQIPFTPTDDQITGPDPAHINTEKKFRGKPWPTCFGKVIDVPAQLVREGPRATTLTAVYNYTTSFFIQTDPESEANPFPINGTNISIFVDDDLVTGSFGSGANTKLFTITAQNQVQAVVSSGLRPVVGVDPDAARADVMYVQGSANTNGVVSYPQITGLWLTATAPAGKIAGAVQNYCIKQVGAKCYFLNNWVRTGFTNWKVGGTNGGVPDGTITLACRRYNTVTFTTWQHGAGATVRLKGNRHKIFVASDSRHVTGSTDVKRVRAYRQVPVGDADSRTTIRQLVTVPASYYEVTLETIGGVLLNCDSTYAHTMADGTTQRPLTIKFAPPLEERNQGWEDNQIFVSLSTHNGAPASGVDRNVSTHIKHILTKYSQLTADATTFASVLATTAVWKSDFAILQTGDAWQVCQDIAWQMRCSLLQIGNNVKIKYLSITEPPGSPDGNVDVKDDYILLDEGSAIVENDLEDRVTVFTAIYQNSYANPVPQKIIKRVNTTVLGERLGSFNFTIFQNKELVEQSAEWWSQHYGRVWKKIIVTGPLPLITFEPFDLCKVNLPNIIHTTNFRGIVESMTHDTLNHRIGLQIWTPVEGGTNSTSSKGWLNVADPSVAAQADPFDNLTTGTDDLVAWAPSADGK